MEDSQITKEHGDNDSDENETINRLKRENALLVNYIKKLKNAFHHSQAIQFEQESILDQLINDDSDIDLQQKTIDQLKRKIAKYEKEFGVIGDEFNDDDVEVLRLRKENVELIRSSKKKDEEILELRKEITQLKKALLQQNTE